MLTSHTPSFLLASHVDTLRSLLPGVFDGDATSVHDARVATRRIRELLRLGNGSSERAADELRGRFRKMGRALGRVRDTDVRIGHLSRLEVRIPTAAPWLVTVRYEQEIERLKLMRRLIKRLERLAIGSLLGQIMTRDSALRRILPRVFGTGLWRRHLAQTMRERGEESASAIERATRVYFPNRVHAARIALKKLRYAMEIAAGVGSALAAARLGELKKGQDVLGELHDRQTLLDELPELSSKDGAELDVFVAHVKPVLEAEAQDYHRRYLARRDGLLDIARGVQVRRVDRPLRSASLITAGALALSTGAYVMRRRLALPPSTL